MATHTQTLPPPLSNQLEDRQRIVSSALGTTLAEGVSPGPDVIALSESYVAGEITLDQFSSSVRALSGL